MTTEAVDLVVRRSVTVNVPVERAFEVFTQEIAAWWPIETHSLAEGEPVFEPRAGGRVYERAGAEEHFWANVVAFEPPHRVVLEWRVNPEAPAATDLEVTFTPAGDGTRVDVVHSGFDRFGEKAHGASAGYSEGWKLVLGRYAERASA